ncbi:MAG: hypothetical protein OEY10_00315 [Nitrosopumilus sp.]|nr:hypothetical protein [Nitrosopumilus sp.]
MTNTTKKPKPKVIQFFEKNTGGFGDKTKYYIGESPSGKELRAYSRAEAQSMAFEGYGCKAEFD